MAKEETFGKNEYPRANSYRHYNIFVDKDLKYRQTFEYFRVLNMPRIMSMSGFRIFQGSEHNESKLGLEEVALIFEILNLVFLLKQKSTTLYFRYL